MKSRIQTGSRSFGVKIVIRIRIQMSIVRIRIRFKLKSRIQTWIYCRSEEINGGSDPDPHQNRTVYPQNRSLLIFIYCIKCTYMYVRLTDGHTLLHTIFKYLLSIKKLTGSAFSMSELVPCNFT